MCDYAGKLVAWLDRELDDDGKARMEHHLGVCGDCREQLSKYAQVSKAFDSYCEATMVTRTHRGRFHRVPILSGVAATALATTVILVLVHSHFAPLPAPRAAAATPSPIVVKTAPTPSKIVHRRHSASLVPARAVDALSAEPAIQIAIPAESIFPPGAIPEGVNFTADVSFAPDGTTQQIRLRPRLLGFEKGAPQP